MGSFVGIYGFGDWNGQALRIQELFKLGSPSEGALLTTANLRAAQLPQLLQMRVS